MGSGGNLPIGPGIWGFIAFFVLAVSLWLLVRNMNTRLRRMAYRDREQTEADAITRRDGDETRPADGGGPGDDTPGEGTPGDDPREAGSQRAD